MLFPAGAATHAFFGAARIPRWVGASPVSSGGREASKRRNSCSLHASATGGIAPEHERAIGGEPAIRAAWHLRSNRVRSRCAVGGRAVLVHGLHANSRRRKIPLHTRPPKPARIVIGTTCGRRLLMRHGSTDLLHPSADRLKKQCGVSGGVLLLPWRPPLLPRALFTLIGHLPQSGLSILFTQLPLAVRVFLSCVDFGPFNMAAGLVTVLHRLKARRSIAKFLHRDKTLLGCLHVKVSFSSFLDALGDIGFDLRVAGESNLHCTAPR